MYMINDRVEFEAYISQFDPETSTLEPYLSIEDMQIEFTMLDPHIRTALKPAAGEPGKYGVAFRAPDRHSVFKFVINDKPDPTCRAPPSFRWFPYAMTSIPVS